MLLLLNSETKFNAIHLTFAKKLDFLIKPIDIQAPKIDNIMLETYAIIIAAFLMTDKANQVIFYDKTFFVANISPKIVLGYFSLP